MGLLRRDDEPSGTRLLMREKLLSVGDDSWVQDESGNNVYKVNGKKLRIQETFVLEDPSGNEVLHIQADLPHGKFTNEKAKRLLNWQPRDGLEAFWQRDGAT